LINDKLEDVPRLRSADNDNISVRQLLLASGPVSTDYDALEESAARAPSVNEVIRRIDSLKI
jgi:hypothetical protein